LGHLPQVKLQPPAKYSTEQLPTWLMRHFAPFGLPFDVNIYLRELERFEYSHILSTLSFPCFVHYSC
jgi:hypothetical protein